MSFFKSLKGKLRDDGSNNQSSPEIDYDNNTTKREKHRLFGLSSSTHNNDNDNITSSKSTHNTALEYQPPQSPPPSAPKRSDTNPPPYQDWLSVPDNSQLPPPPALFDAYSPTNNASADAAERGRAWCAAHPVFSPVAPSQSVFESVSLHGDILLQAPSGRHGVKVERLPPQPEYGLTSRFSVSSPRGCDDVVLLSSLPLYFAAASNPLLQSQNQQHPGGDDKFDNSNATAQPVTISYTVHITSLPTPDSIIAVGFAGKPYPPFRQPGWHRSSLAVHSDDGRRYIHDPYGGIPFIKPLVQNDKVTISMTFHPEYSPLQHTKSREAVPVSGLPKCRTNVDVYINGHREGGWDVHEEKDSKMDRGVEGLQGEGDLYAAVGVFGKVGCEVRFGPGRVPHV